MCVCVCVCVCVRACVCVCKHSDSDLSFIDYLQMTDHIGLVLGGIRLFCAGDSVLNCTSL